MIIKPMGDNALVVYVGEGISDASLVKVYGLYNSVIRASSPEIIYSIPAYNSLTIRYDERLTNFQSISDWLMDLSANDYAKPPSRLHSIGVDYSDQYALDMDHVCRLTSLSKDEVISYHCDQEYTVYMLGFLPGFAYLGTTHKSLHVPRHDVPRTLVTKGSIGLAGQQTAIYPVDSPGGWQIIGKALVDVFDTSQDEPFLLSPFDTVHFYPIRR
jgi:inhibitor of KinA